MLEIKKVVGDFLTRNHTSSLKKGVSRHIFAFVLMQMCAGLKVHMREVIDYVFCTLCMVCQSSAFRRNRQDCNRQSMQRVQNQARSQLGTLGVAKSFLRGPDFLNYVQHVFPGGEIFFTPLPLSYGPVQNTWSIWTGLCLNARAQNVAFQTAIFLILVVRNNNT